jgi:hypothetical protein
VFKSASKVEARTKRLEMFAVCTQIEDAVNTILRNVKDKRIAIRLLMLTRDQIVGEYPKHAITELTTVRSLLDVVMKHEMMSVIGEEGAKAELIVRWEKIATNYGMLLDLVLLPNSTCACRKLDPPVLMMKSAEDRLSSELAEPLDRPTAWRVLV